MLKAFEDVRLGLFKVTPKWMRAHLKDAHEGAGWLQKGLQTRDTLLLLLQYCLSDMVLGAPSGPYLCERV